MNRSLSTADTRAAHAALARPAVPEPSIDRYLLVDDSDDDMTQILTVLCESTFPKSRPNHLDVEDVFAAKGGAL
jgi:hypothetical protein